MTDEVTTDRVMTEQVVTDQVVTDQLMTDPCSNSVKFDVIGDSTGAHLPRRFCANFSWRCRIWTRIAHKNDSGLLLVFPVVFSLYL